MSGDAEPFQEFGSQGGQLVVRAVARTVAGDVDEAGDAAAGRPRHG